MEAFRALAGAGSSAILAPPGGPDRQGRARGVAPLARGSLPTSVLVPRMPLPHSPGSSSPCYPAFGLKHAMDPAAAQYVFAPDPSWGRGMHDTPSATSTPTPTSASASASSSHHPYTHSASALYISSSSPSTSRTSASPAHHHPGSSTSPPSASGSNSRSAHSASPLAHDFPAPAPSTSAAAEDDGSAGDQPRIPIACSICRKRKTKCDGLRPTCSNCVRRGDLCEYEAQPKRRGPDRRPGTRVRSVYSRRLAEERGLVLPAVEKRKRKREREDPARSVGKAVERDAEREGREEKKIKMEYEPFLAPSDPSQPSSSQPDRHSLPLRQAAYITELEDAWVPGVPGGTMQVDARGKQPAPEQEREQEIVRQPSVDFARKTWWDSLLEMYAGSREVSYKQIQTDIAYVFCFSPYFISFFNVPLFWTVFHSPPRRDTLQPSLVLSFLALATFMRSSEVGAGLAGRERALQIAEIARAYYQSSIDAGWIDHGLAQAAFMLTLFEMCPHPQYTAHRLASSFWALDGVLATLGWTSMDAYDYDAAVFVGLVPSMSQHAQHTPAPRLKDAGAPTGPGAGDCACTRFSLPSSSDSAQRITPLWAATPAWDPDWTEPDIRKEEARRIVWNSLNLMSGHTSVTLASGEGAADYWCTRAENYALLFPGEALLRSQRYADSFTRHPRDSIWAVYGRLALLYGACWRYFSPEASAARPRPKSRSGLPRTQPADLCPQSEGERAEFAYRAYVETLELEDILDQHGCAGERSTLFQGREFLFKIRVLISKDYTKHFPFPETGIDLSFHKKKAEQWLWHQMNLAQRLMQGLNSVTGMGMNDLRLRPFLLWYFALQSQRCLQFHGIDPSLTVALDVADAWMMPVDYLVQIWPCANMEPFFDDLRRRILAARMAADMPPCLPRGKPIEVVNPMLSAPSAAT